MSVNISSKYGTKSFSEVQIGSFNFSGCLDIKKCTTATLKVNGLLKMSDSQSRKVTVFGMLQMEQSTVEEDLSVTGAIQATDSVVNGLLSIITSSNQISLKNLKTKNIIIKKTNINKPLTVFLKGSTIVDGSITLEASSDKVVVSTESLLTGNVFGGSLQHE
ncbi:MAG: hypothetical protein WCT85_00140 [Parachlamydiales bacterium]|jgi:cytoskeletal protein CcmA (bactofilin family)